MQQLHDGQFATWTEDDLLHLLRTLGDSSDGLDLAIAQMILKRALARVGATEVTHVAFDIDVDGYGFLLGVGVTNARDRSGAQVELPTETVDALNRAMLEPYAILVDRQRLRRPASAAGPDSIR